MKIDANELNSQKASGIWTTEYLIAKLRYGITNFTPRLHAVRDDNNWKTDSSIAILQSTALEIHFELANSKAYLFSIKLQEGESIGIRNIFSLKQKDELALPIHYAIDDHDDWMFKYFTSANLLPLTAPLVYLDGISYCVRVMSSQMKTVLYFDNPQIQALQELEAYAWSKSNHIAIESQNKSLCDFAKQWSSFLEKRNTCYGQVRS